MTKDKVIFSIRVQRQKDQVFSKLIYVMICIRENYNYFASNKLVELAITDLIFIKVS